MKVIGIVQARMSSQRLPAKILAPLAGHPLLAVLRGRTQSAAVDQWWLATSAHAEDDVTARWGTTLGMQVYRGDLDNVLSRFTGILRRAPADWVVRVTADDPFVDGAAINLLLAGARSASTSTDVVKAATPRILPLGYMPELVRAASLMTAEEQIPVDEVFHRAHVTSWLRKHGGVAPVRPPDNWPARAPWRWTVDTPEDLDMARQAFDLFGADWPRLQYPEIVEMLDARPEIVNVNLHVKQKAVAKG